MYLGSICLDECGMCTYVQYVYMNVGCVPMFNMFRWMCDVYLCSICLINVGCVPMFNMFRLDECGMCTYVQYV